MEFLVTLVHLIGGFHVMSSQPCWWTRTINFSLAPFVRPPAFVHFTIVICVSRDWLQPTYTCVRVLLNLNKWIIVSVSNDVVTLDVDRAVSTKIRK